MLQKSMAQQMFEAYNAQGPNPNKTWDGKDVPTWENLNDQVRGKWDAAAMKALDEILGDLNTKSVTFSRALSLLTLGKKMRRAGWTGKGMWIELQVPDANSKMKRPYIFIVPVDGDPVPWVASQVDLLSPDWELIDG